MKQEEENFLFDLLETPSPSGFEHRGQKLWIDYVCGFTDEVGSDSYGSAWATLRGEASAETDHPLMLEAHCDEIGFMVSHISSDGFLYVRRIGGTDHATARGKRVRILGAASEVLGVIGNTAIHLRERKDEKVPEWHQLFIDIGARSKEEAEKLGIRVGLPAVYLDAPMKLNDTTLVGRALDNRIGGFIIASVLRELSKSGKPKNSVHAVNSVQEEIGLKGAQMIAYRMKPAMAVVLDVTHATDSPGIEHEKFGKVELGKGPTITHGTSNQRQLVERIMNVAESHSIPLQHEASSSNTGTDSDSIYVTAGGIPSALISLPMRYMHSTVETVDLRDVENCIRLICETARSLGEDSKGIVSPPF